MGFETGSDLGSGIGSGMGADMSETAVTVVGNAATQVDLWETGEGVPRARFRLAATARRWDRWRQGWTAGHTSYYMVWASHALAANLATSVTVGEPLVVQGWLRVREEEHDGRPRLSADIDATAVGHDLACGTTVFRRVSVANPALTAPIGG
ncbi:single-stranded DNA-binding protein [Streptomyces sp. 8N616]|uniref:single-stranded DNA-binding protein n=1 Tax=Streptomyces sp. 8N616 TaxID=3457414 RepID=UPI003FCFFF62